MPQFNHFETREGQIIDPTFGLNALDAETKRKTKAREQMNMATNVIRQSLSAEGKGLTADTTVEIDEGGRYTFKGASGTKDLANLYNIRNANYGKSGYGDKSTETLNQTNSKHAEYAVKQRQEDAKPRHEAAQSLLGGILSGTGLSPTKGMKSGTSSGVGLNVTDASSMSGNDMIDVQKDVSIAVDDKVQMNESDLRVAAAMEALNAQLYGGDNPGTYKALMEENSKTFQRVNEANKLENHATEQKLGPAFHVQDSMSTGGDKRDSKDFAPVSSAPRETPKTKAFTQADSLSDNVVAELDKDRNYTMQSGTSVLYKNKEIIDETGRGSGIKYKANADGTYMLDPSVNQSVAKEKLYNVHVANLQNKKPLNDHRWIVRESPDKKKKYIAFERDTGGGKWEEIGYHAFDALNPTYSDGKTFKSSRGKEDGDNAFTPMMKIRAVPGKFGASGTKVKLNEAEADALFGDQGT